MRLLFDHNLSPRLPNVLAVEYPKSAHVREFGMASAPDISVWEYAAAEGYAIVSKDSDFEQKAFLYGHPPKVIWLRVGNCPTTVIAAFLRNHLADVLAFEADPAAAVLALA